MNSFSEWRDNGPLNESTNLADALRSRLSSSTSYLKQALNVTNEETSASSPQAFLREDDLKKQIHSLEDKIKKEIEKTRDEIAIGNKEVEPEETLAVSSLPEEVEMANDNDYRLYRDKEETFECSISVEGASLSSTQARIVIDTSVMSLIFYGKLYKDGRCLVPLKKMTMLPEGTRGQIRLEVIVDDTFFSPWESSCVVEGSKKVFVDIKQKKNVSINFE